MPAYSFRSIGVDDQQLNSYTRPGTTAPRIGTSSPQVIVLDLLDEADARFLAEGLSSFGFEYAGVGDLRTSELVQVRRTKLDTNGVAVTVPTFTDALTQTITTRGGTVLEIDGVVTAAVLVGGTARLVINGGSFSPNTVIDTSTLLVLAAGKMPLRSFVEIPSSSQSYTIKLQVAAAALGSVTAQAGGTSLYVREFTS